jgi:hypothetical protein
MLTFGDTGYVVLVEDNYDLFRQYYLDLSTNSVQEVLNFIHFLIGEAADSTALFQALTVKDYIFTFFTQLDHLYRLQTKRSVSGEQNEEEQLEDYNELISRSLDSSRRASEGP